ncbi:MAG: flagellar basal body L-ring protein FlgH [Acetobacteraceae bacterium]|nr:flagellar basal body L-ring protein FlgH [Acetobacteraceae bacterium]
MIASRALAPAVALILLLPGCGSLQRLSEVGRPPAMTPSSDPTADPAYRPITMPMPRPQTEPAEANSLWRQGSRAFFKDQRAANVGDIVTVLVNITDNADLSNQSTATRNGTESLGVPNLLGLERSIPRVLGKSVNPSSLVSTTSNNASTGNGAIKRNEIITLRLAGVITQVLPNGNLTVAARQEVRVNSELRDLQVSGVIRPQDIASDNTVHHDRMAEARISYGGRGQITDVQRPRYGQQLLDILLPF